MPPQPDDSDEQHVLVIGETEENVNHAVHLIEKILYSDDETRNRIKEEQLKASQEMRTAGFMNLTDANGKPIHQEIEDYLMTPYGPPDKNARILPVPNDCVGLIIGKNGETIRRLHRETGCKIQIAKKEIPNTEVRNVFIEGPPEKYESAKKAIEDIISDQYMNQNFSHTGDVNPFPGPHTKLKIPNKMVGLIIGKGGDTVRIIHQKTNCYIFIPKESKPGEDFRELELSGPPTCIEECKREIVSMIHIALYGSSPYSNSVFYPYTDSSTGLPVIDPGVMANLDPTAKGMPNMPFLNDEERQREILERNEENLRSFQQGEIDLGVLQGAGNPYGSFGFAMFGFPQFGTKPGMPNMGIPFLPFGIPSVGMMNPSNSISSLAQQNSSNKMNSLTQHLTTGESHSGEEKQTGETNHTNSNSNPNILNSINPLGASTNLLASDMEKIRQAARLAESNRVVESVDYDLEDYNNPLNYNLYYQQLYHMYPQVGDYYPGQSKGDDMAGDINKFLLKNAGLDSDDPKKKN